MTLPGAVKYVTNRFNLVDVPQHIGSAAHSAILWAWKRSGGGFVTEDRKQTTVTIDKGKPGSVELSNMYSIYNTDILLYIQYNISKTSALEMLQASKNVSCARCFSWAEMGVKSQAFDGLSRAMQLGHVGARSSSIEWPLSKMPSWICKRQTKLPTSHWCCALVVYIYELYMVNCDDIPMQHKRTWHINTCYLFVQPVAPWSILNRKHIVTGSGNNSNVSGQVMKKPSRVTKSITKTKSQAVRCCEKMLKQTYFSDVSERQVCSPWSLINFFLVVHVFLS